MTLLNQQHQDANSFEIKVNEFQTAMRHYLDQPIYRKTGLVVSILILSLQAVAITETLYAWKAFNPFYLFFLFITAYIFTDFINGLVHLYMDNNTHYSTLFGPFIAAFHVHHLTPRYAHKHPALVYFYESGSKFWLLIYLAAWVSIAHSYHFSFEVQFFFTGFALLSSFAEVSHYWSHARHPSMLIRCLQKYRILLSKKHHKIHHTDDNKNYAFLNGLSDPLINLIASYVYEGYKNNADAHAKSYTGDQTKNKD